MKKKHLTYAKKTLSVFLTVLMLMSAWVFVAPEHSHVSAASVVSATKNYNESLLNGINTSIDTTMPTTMGKFKDPNMEGDENASWHVSQYGSKHYKNIFYSPTVDQNGYAVYMGNDVIPNIDSVRIYYPETVMIYDGSTKPQMGVVTCLDASNDNYIRALSVYLSANQNGLVLTDHWKGHTTGNLAHIINIENGSYKFSNDGTEHSSYKINTEAKGEWYFYASDLRFDGTLGATEWVRTITPTWGFYGARSYKSWGSWKYDTIQKFTKVATKNIYVMNIKGYRDLISTIATDKTNITNKAGQYTPESVKAYVNAANAILNLNPKNVTQSGSAVATWGTNMSTAYTNYVNAKNGLKNREFEVTYENIFSLADWKYSTSSEKANVSVDLSEGKISVKNANASDEYVTPHSGSSVNANTRNKNHYAMPVTGGQEYTFRYTTDGADTQMFAFFYDANGGCTHEATFGNYNFTVKNGTDRATFRAPDNSVCMEIRLDNNTPGTTANFTGIMIYPANRDDAVDVNNWFSRPYRKLYSYNASVGDLDTPARDGYTFSGWKTDTDADGVGDAAAPTGNITENKVLYSTWTPTSYTLTFDGNGGNPSVNSLEYNIEGTVKFPTAERESYALDSWKILTAGGNWGINESYAANSTVTGKYGNVTLTAQWTKLYAVKFLDGDNSTVLHTAYVKNGGTVDPLPTVTPTKASDATNKYEFESWSANGTAFNENTVITADVTVSPVFKSTAHSNFKYQVQLESDCENNALVIKKCGVCNYSFGEVRYDPAEDVNAEANKSLLAKGHTYTGGILVGSSTGNTHLIKCIRYDTCGSTESAEHIWNTFSTEGANCSNPGTAHQRCACGAERDIDGTIAPDVHNYILTKGTSNGDGTHTVACEYNSAHTKSVVCEDNNDDCKCDVCDYQFEHVYDKETKTFVKTKADCYNDAVYYLTCKCGEKGGENDTWTDEGSMLKHNWTDTETNLKSEADCENDEVYYQECSLCKASSEDITGSTWTKANTKKGHAYTGTVRDNKDGTHSYLCANGCGTYGYEGVKEASKACTYGEWSKTEADTHTKTCTECKYSVTEDHDWTAWTSTDKDKTAAGQHTRSCKDCGRVETVGCTYTDVETKNTCTEDGYTTHTCNDCGHKYVTAGATKTGHDYTGAVKSYNNGKHNYLCKNGCNTYGYDTVENATTDCTYKYKNNKEGEHQVTCTECDYTFAQSCSGGTATCTAPATCEKCNTAYGTTAPHSFKGEAVKLEGDFHAYLCEFCGETTGIKGVGDSVDGKEACSGGTATCSALAVCVKCGDGHGELDADAHKWGAWTNIAGTETHTRVCEYNEEHTQTEECFGTSPAVAAPDCETAGFTLNTCDDCGHTWQTDIVDPLGHDWSAWTKNGDGTHTRVCERAGCHYGAEGSAKTETADCTKENATFVVTDPTCTEGGYTTYTCKDCGYVWTDDPTEATGHSYAEMTKKTDSKYLRTTKDCTTDWTYWYCCDNCDVSAETEKDKYDDITALYWVREAATGHKFDAKKAEKAYLASEATCTAKATYYYSCSVCGASSKDTADAKTFEYGSLLGHDWQNTETFKKSDADCINNEVYYKECSRCNISSKGVTDATWEKENTKAGHDFDHDDDGVIGNEGDAGYTAGVAAECLKDGMTEHYTCQTCGKHYTDAAATKEIAADKLVIPGLRHDYKDVNKKDATCEEDGYTAHKQCQRAGCGYRNSDYKVIPAKGHDFKAENGYYCDTIYNYHAYKCSNCECYGVDNVKYSVDASGLDPEIVGGIACNFTGEYVNYEDENGIHSHKLTCECGNVQGAVCVDEDGPVYTDPVCEKDGFDTYECTVCGYEWTVADEGTALEHDLKTKSNGNGTHSVVCERGCGYAEAAEKCSTETPATVCGTYDICDVCKTAFGKAKPHAFTNYVSDENATCTADGTKTAVCDTCTGEDKAKDTVTDKGSKLGHNMTEYGYDISGWTNKPADFSEVIAESTCCTEGKAISYCTRCDKYDIKTVKADPNKHQWAKDEASEDGLLWVTVSGDCSTGVTVTNTCTVAGCGKVQTKVIYDVEHTYEVIYEELPTCKDEGVRVKECVLCGERLDEHYNQETGEPADLAPTGNHTYVVISSTPATCTKNAYVTKQCKVCAETVIEETEGTMLEHAYIEYDEVAPGCETDGHSAYLKCSDCGAEKDKTVIEATGHTDANADGKCDDCFRLLYEGGEKSCGCICHKDSFLMRIIYKILNFFWKLFKISKSCNCGATHW